MAKTTVASDEITIAQAVPLLQLCIDEMLPSFIWGASGIGKSDVVRQIATNLKDPNPIEKLRKPSTSIDCRLHLMQPTDLMGIPYFNKTDNTMSWAPPVMLPTEEFASQYYKVILFLDEMNTAPPSTQASAYQLVLDRAVGKYKLPDNVIIVAAGNRQSDRGVNYKMPAPLANRFTHIELRSDFESWFTWAVNNNVHPDVVGFIGNSKRRLHDFDPTKEDKAFPTPRSWSVVSRLIQKPQVSSDQLMHLIGGTVGQGAALEFMSYRAMAAELPNPSDVLDGKVKTLKTREMSAQYSLVIGMAYELRERKVNGEALKIDEKTWNANVSTFLRFMMDNMEVEMNVLAARIVLKTYNLPIVPQKVTCMDEFYKKYGKYVLQATNS